jgi:hypothetical protein
MKRLPIVLLGVLLLLGRPALPAMFAMSPAAAIGVAAGKGCACGKSCCCVSPSDRSPAPLSIPLSLPAPRVDFQSAIGPSPLRFSFPPLLEFLDVGPVSTSVPSSVSVPIYDRDCSYLI